MRILLVVSVLILICGCGDNSESKETSLEVQDKDISDISDVADKEDNTHIEKTGSMELKYANQFCVDYYEGGYAYIKIEDGNEYVLVPEGGIEDKLGYENAVILQKPLDSIYLSASASMDLFRQLDRLDVIKTCSTKAEDYSIKEAAELIENGDIAYVGKYSAPDYEKLLAADTKIAIESTMIYHSPQIKEELEKLGIKVLVERSSYEEKPLGRLEWIKLYGLLLDKENEANEYFDAEDEKAEKISKDTLDDNDTNHPSVVFFYIASNGYVNVRKPGDYISKMIEMAGGEYAIKSIEAEENALSTMNISWEDFYAYAKDADILIYNSTIDGGITSKEELLLKNELFEDFSAYQNDKVYASNNNMFQETSKMADIMVDIRHLILGEENLIYIRKL